MFRLDNKVAFVTGGSRGIARATALALANAGARVLLHDGKSADHAKALADTIRQNGGKVREGRQCGFRRGQSD